MAPAMDPRAATRWAVLLAAATVSCAAPDRGPPSPPERRVEAQPPALVAAIERWHQADDIEPLARYVAANPGAQDGVWREVVALRRYDACDRAGTDAQALRTVAHDFPDTVAGRLASATLLGDGLGRLRAEVPGPLVVDFLDGGDAWARDGHGQLQLGVAELERAQAEQAPGLRDRFAAALAADGCATTMGYCSWWSSRYPNDPRTAGIIAAAKQTWYRRGHPTWQGGEHARCAARCVKRCKAIAAVLDDSCWQPCYARC